MLDTNNAIAVGAFGLKALTKDGGINWSAGYKPKLDLFINDVSYIDRNSIIICGNKGIYKTTNGGYSWNKKNLENKAFLYKIGFLNSKNGIGLGYDSINGKSRNIILNTTDGGETWRSQNNDSIKFISFSYIKNSTIAYVITESKNIYYLYKTINGGLNYFLVKENIPEMQHLEFIDSQIGIGTLGSTIYRTEDGGFTWTYQSNLLFGTVSYLSFSDVGYGIAASHEYDFIITTNGGLTWSAPIDNNNSLHITGVSMVGKGHITVIRGCANPGPAYGSAEQSTDAGETWSFTSRSKFPFINLDFFDEYNGIIIGENGTILTNSSYSPLPVELWNYDSPLEFLLEKNYPNPFNPTTKINYTIANDGRASLIIYDVLGREVQKLFDEEKLKGNYSVEFNASELSSGIYFYRLNIDGFSETKKMMLMK